MSNKAISLVPHLNIQTRIEVVTPEMASQYLGTMAGNRSLRKRAVNRYAREMIAGKWQVNGEAIKFGRSGRLIDGQHRLQAVIEAGMPVPMCVTRGLDDSAITTLDTGVGRNYTDTLVIRGKTHSQHVAPIARWWYKYEQGSPTVGYTPTHQELDDVVDRHPYIIESSEFMHKLPIVRKRCIPGVQGFVHAYATEMWDRETADLYCYTLNDGTGLTQRSPIFHLRRKLVDEDSTRIEAERVLAFSIKAFNAFVTGKEVGNLTWATGGAKPEPFPRFVRDVKPASVERKAEQHQKFIAMNKSPEHRQKVAETNRRRGKGGR